MMKKPSNASRIFFCYFTVASWFFSFVSGNFYLGNFDEFYIPSEQFLTINFILSAATSLALFLFDYALINYTAKIVYRKLVAFLFITSYIHLFFPFSKGTQFLDGRKVNFEFSALIEYGSLALLIILGIMFLRLKFGFFTKLKTRYFVYIALFFNLYPPAVVLTQLADNKTPLKSVRPKSPAKFDIKEVYGFSKNKNTIVIMFDSLSADVMFKEASKHQEAFSDFIYYKDSIGTTPQTLRSVYSFYLGKFFDEPYISFNKNHKAKVQSKSFINTLTDSGWHTSTFTQFQNVCPHSISICSTPQVTLFTEYEFLGLPHEYLKLLDILALKVMPPILKKYYAASFPWPIMKLAKAKPTDRIDRITNDAKQAVSLNQKHQVFLDSWSEYSQLTFEQPVFKFIHSLSTHIPFELNEDCQLANKRNEYKNYVNSVKCTIPVLKRLFTKLKQLNIYDKSELFIISDHGFPFERAIDSAQESQIRKQLAVANALLMYKPLNHGSESMKVSLHPVSTIDVTRTICENAELKCNHKEGIVLPTNSDSSLNLQRKRKYAFHEYGYAISNSKGIEYFEVSSPFWQKENWKIIKHNSGKDQDKTP